MHDVVAKLIFYFGFPFVRYALVVAILISLCAALLGVPLVLKRYSYLGDGLSNVAFGSVAIASVFNLTNNIFITVPITVLAAVLLLRYGQNRKIQGDAAIAMVSVSSLAIGYLLMNVFSTSSNLAGDVCVTLFGSTSILTLRRLDVYVCIGLSLLVLVFYVLYYNRIFALTFDEDFASIGKRHGYDLVIAVVTGLVIVLAMNLVGSLLITALVVFPAISSMRLLKSFKAVIVASGLIAVVAAVVGLLLSILVGTPVGSTIVAIHVIIFVLMSLIQKGACWL